MIVKIDKVNRNQSWGALDTKTNKVKDTYDNCVDKFVPALDVNTGKLRTGLTDEDRIKLELDLELEPGELLSKSPYWNSFFITIPEGGATLNTNNDADLLKYKVLLADPEVANGMTTLKTHPTAKYVITSQSEEAKVSNVKRDVIAKAYAKFVTMSSVEMVNALFMFGKDASRMEPEIAKDRLGDLVESNPGKFLSIVGDKLFKDKVWMMQLIKLNIVKKHGVGVGTEMPLYYQDILLGTGLEQSIAFIKDKENQNIFLGIKKEFDSKK
jgi:hypothetical protein